MGFFLWWRFLALPRTRVKPPAEVGSDWAVAVGVAATAGVVALDRMPVVFAGLASGGGGHREVFRHWRAASFRSFFGGPWLQVDLA